MPDDVTLDQIEALVARLSAEDRRLLVKKILGTLAGQSDAAAARPHWRDIRGLLKYPACGEDAQEWISRSREEADAAREEGRRAPS